MDLQKDKFRTDGVLVRHIKGLGIHVAGSWSACRILVCLTGVLAHPSTEAATRP